MNKQVRMERSPSFVECIGLAIDPLDRDYHFKPAKNERLPGRIKAIMNGKAFTRNGVHNHSKMEEQAIDDLPAIYPAQVRVDHIFGKPDPMIGALFTERWVEQVAAQGIECPRHLGAIFLCITGTDVQFASSRVHSNPELFQSLWPAKMLKAAREKAESLVDVPDIATNMVTGSRPLISMATDGYMPWAPVVHKREDKRAVIELLNMLHAIMSDDELAKAYEDYVIETLWLIGYLTDSVEVFMMQLHELGITPNLERFPYMNHEAIAVYTDFLNEESAFGFTNFDAIRDGLEKITNIFSDISESRDTMHKDPSLGLAKTWEYLLRIKGHAQDINQNKIFMNLLEADQVAAKKSVAKLIDIVRELDGSLSDVLGISTLQNAATPLENGLRHIEGVSFTVSESYLTLPMVQKLRGSEAMSDRDSAMFDAAARLHDALEGYKGRYKSVTEMAAVLDPDDDEAFNKLGEARVELKKDKEYAGELADTLKRESECYARQVESFAGRLSEVQASYEAQVEASGTNQEVAELTARIADLESEVEAERAKVTGIRLQRDELEERQHQTESKLATLEQLLSSKSVSAIEAEYNDDCVVMSSDLLCSAVASRSALEGILGVVCTINAPRCEVAPNVWRSVASNKEFSRVGVFQSKLSTLLSEQFMEDYQNEGADGAFKHFTKTELSFNESKTTMGKVGDTRMFTFESGETKLCDAHLRLGVSGTKQHMLRIYFCIEDGKVFIGEIVDHLPTGSKH